MIEIDSDIIRNMVAKNRRIDHRKFDEYRKISIEIGVVKSAEGSARVKLGDTDVIAGVKIDIGTPYPDTPDEGALSVAAELLPLASPEFESGPPGENAIELARVVDRAIRESKAIEFEKLCIEPGKKVWVVYVDIDVLDDDGNLIDACGIAAVSALLTAKIPKIEKEGDDYKVDYEVKDKHFPMMGIPVSTTIVKIGDSIITDPNLAELHAMDSRLTVGTLEGHICSMQKGGSGGFSVEEVEKIVDMAEKKGNELRKIIDVHVRK
ncbi:MAG: exosome complex protein Rrp42 [Candidatus Aenigmarchaeota archaeon]|nr:exosome complex protein Rrp42 [Candidatus Aenigmarchaeota archaeon]